MLVLAAGVDEAPEDGAVFRIILVVCFLSGNWYVEIIDLALALQTSNGWYRRIHHLKVVEVEHGCQMSSRWFSNRDRRLRAISRAVTATISCLGERRFVAGVVGPISQAVPVTLSCLDRPSWSR